MKLFKLTLSLFKNWKVLLTFGSVLGFAYCGFVENGQGTNYTWSASTGVTPAGPGRVSSSGGSSVGGGGRRSEDDPPPKRLILQTQDDDQSIDVDDYLKQVAFFYMLAGKCGQESQAASYSPCVVSCLSVAPRLRQTCLNACKTRSESNTCDLAGVFAGSGVFYDTNKVLTNHHVIKEVLTYTDPDDNKFYFSISAVWENYAGHLERMDSSNPIEWHDQDSDVAMVELESAMSGIDTVSLGGLEDDVSLLNRVFTIGNPLSLEWIAAQGYITGYGRSTRGFDIYHSIRTYRGNSGGGLFDLESGKLIGIHKGVWTERDLSPSEANKRPHRSVDDDHNILTMGLGTHVDKIKELIANQGGGGGTQQSFIQNQSLFEDMSEDDREQTYRRIVEYVRENYEED